MLFDRLLEAGTPTFLFSLYQHDQINIEVLVFQQTRSCTGNGYDWTLPHLCQSNLAWCCMDGHLLCYRKHL